MTETLYIDAKEPVNIISTVKQETTKRNPEINTEIESLKTGDFVMNDVVIERKEGSDLVSSITDGRLRDQEHRMVQDFNHQYIIIQDSPYNLKHSNLHHNSIVGTQISAATKKGIKILYVEGEQELAYAVYKIIQTHLDDEEYSPETEMLKRTRADTEDTFIAMLTCIEGISQEKAESIRDKRGWSSMYDLIGARHEPGQMKNDLMMIDGIGEVLAERIINSLGPEVI